MVVQSSWLSGPKSRIIEKFPCSGAERNRYHSWPGLVSDAWTVQVMTLPSWEGDAIDGTNCAVMLAWSFSIVPDSKRNRHKPMILRDIWSLLKGAGTFIPFAPTKSGHSFFCPGTFG